MFLTFIAVLQRHESLAANLGAKLVGPLLLKSFEKLFDGPIKTIFGLEQSPITWLDIVTFARSNPSEFILSETAPGVKACRFWIKGGQVEISEDDYRLIMSGGPERMIPTQPIAEDESAELGTLNILGTRLAVLIKKADAVASKARQLNYHLKGRKTAVMARKAVGQAAAVDSEETRTFTAQPFSAINSRSPNPVNGEDAKLQQELLDQFLSTERRHSAPHHRPKANRITTSDSTFHAFNGSQHDSSDRRNSHPLSTSEDGSEGQYRVLMAAKIEKLSRGDAINPPCDRCRRLKFDCTKHLTACSACTKKHAKCSWKDVKEGEIDTANGFPQVPAAQTQPVQNSGENDHPSAATMDWNADTSPRADNISETAPPGAAKQQSMDNRMGVQNILEQGNGERPFDQLSSEHAILTQIASAAGSRQQRF